MLAIDCETGSLPYTGYCRDRSSINQTGRNLPVSRNVTELADNSAIQAAEKSLWASLLNIALSFSFFMTFIEFVTLYSNLLLCWHGFCDVNVTVNVGICWRRQ